MEKLGIVFYGRIKSILVGLLSLWIVFFIVTVFGEAIGAYLNKQGFDVTVSEFMSITWVFFFPYFIVSAVIFRALAARISFYHLVKQQIVYPEYTPPAVLSPAETGLLVDNAFHMSEVAATIIDLELRGILSVDKDSLHLINGAEGLSQIEKSFITDLFGSSTEITINPVNGNRILTAGMNLANNTRHQLVQEAQLIPRLKVHKNLRQFMACLIGLALFVQILSTIAFISNPNEVLRINYPRYAMTSSEPVSIILITAIFLIVSMSGFWHKTLKNERSITKWQYVAGLKVYIETVYKGRLYDGDQLTVSKKELKTFYPYAVALGIENDFTNQLERSLLT